MNFLSKWILLFWLILTFSVLILTKLVIGYDTEILKGILIGLHGIVIEVFLIVLVLGAVQQAFSHSQEKKGSM
jgi:hypothetical protein